LVIKNKSVTKHGNMNVKDVHVSAAVTAGEKVSR